MRHLLIIPAMWLATIISAHALSVEVPVTPNTPDQYNYRFSVTANPTNTETAFHVIITNKNENIPDNSSAGLSVVTHTKRGSSIAGFTPTIPITLRKEKRVWTADFSVPPKSLKTDDLCFVFTEVSHAIIDGKRVAMPSATFYEMKLKDFVKQ